MHPAEIWLLREDVAFLMIDAELVLVERAQAKAKGDTPASPGRSGTRRITSMAQLRSVLPRKS